MFLFCLSFELMGMVWFLGLERYPLHVCFVSFKLLGVVRFLEQSFYNLLRDSVVMMLRWPSLYGNSLVENHKVGSLHDIIKPAMYLMYKHNLHTPISLVVYIR